MATFVLVHGGGHGAWCWQRLLPHLAGEAHEAHTLTLTGVGDRESERTPDTDLSTHIADVVSLIEAKDLKRVVLVGHSYGGTVITGVADRVPGRIAELVFLDAPQPGNGQSLADASEELRLALTGSVREIDGVPLTLFPSPQVVAALGMYEALDIGWARPHLTPHPWKCFIEPLDLADESTVLALPRTSIDCIGPLAGRDVGRNAGDPRSGRYREIRTGHNLMILEPRKVAAILLEVAESVDSV